MVDLLANFNDILLTFFSSPRNNLKEKLKNFGQCIQASDREGQALCR